MKQSPEPYEDPEGIVHRISRELQMALQHLEGALEDPRQIEGRQYYLLWCGEHIKKAKWLASMFK